MSVVSDHDISLQQFPAKALEAYGLVEFSRLDRKMAMFRTLPEKDRDLLPEFDQRISALAECIQHNTKLLSIMVQSASSIRAPANSTLTPQKERNGHTQPDAKTESADPGEHKKSKVQLAPNGTAAHEDTHTEQNQFLSRQVRRGFALLAKDWSADGAQQRAIYYGPLIEAVQHAYDEAARASTSLTRNKFRVLVPGAGAGRLPWELVHRGFMVEGCEASSSALLVGNYVLNNCTPDDAITIYPFVHEHSNVRSREQVVRAVNVPDVNPKDIPPDTDFSIRAGSFLEAYDGQDGTWDAVASCMAFDLGESVISHVRRVSQILKPGGTWAFVGPMPCLDGGQNDMIHLSIGEFMTIVRKNGFKMVKQDMVRCMHSSDPESMRAVHVECPLVVALKVRPAL